MIAELKCERAQQSLQRGMETGLELLKMLSDRDQDVPDTIATISFMLAAMLEGEHDDAKANGMMDAFNASLSIFANYLGDLHAAQVERDRGETQH